MKWWYFNPIISSLYISWNISIKGNFSLPVWLSLFIVPTGRQDKYLNQFQCKNCFLAWKMQTESNLDPALKEIYIWHGWRSLVGCSPWGPEESDTTERLHFSLSCIGEGNGNPLQCSCLENPRDSRAWWAAVYGVAQSQTRLKRLSSNNSSSAKLYAPRCLKKYFYNNKI